MTRVEPNRNVYVGHRYVPKIFGEWDKQNQYEGLSIVTHQGNSYTSKKRVPVGIDILNEEYWVVTGNYNAQIEDYRQEVRRLSTDVGNNSTTLIEHDTKIKSNTTNIATNTADIKKAETNIDSIDQRVKTVENLTDPNIDKIDLSVPTDFNDLQSAVDYSLKLKQGIKVEITMESGFKPSKGIYVEDQDASFITISSVDDIVSVDTDYTGHFIHVYKGKAPVLNTLIDSRDMGGDGLRVMFSSSAVVNAQCGVINAGGAGVYCRTSTITAPYSKFTGANDRACWITRASTVSFAQADFSGVKQGTVGIYLSRASNGDFSDVVINDCNVDWAIYIVRSRATMLNAQFNNCTGGGLLATANAKVVISGCSGKNIGGNAIHVNNLSEVQLGANSDVSGAGGTAIMVRNGSSVNATSIRAVDSGEHPLYVEQGSTANVMNLNARNCNGDGVVVTGGSNASIPNCIISTATGSGLKVDDMSYANFSNGLIQNTNGLGVDVSHGSTVNGRNALINFTKTEPGISESGTGIRVSYGSTANLVTTRVSDNSLNDVNIRYGSTVSGYSLTTSNGKPAIEDTNVSAFNTPSGRGIFYV